MLSRGYILPLYCGETSVLPPLRDCAGSGLSSSIVNDPRTSGESLSADSLFEASKKHDTLICPFVSSFGEARVRISKWLPDFTL